MALGWDQNIPGGIRTSRWDQNFPGGISTSQGLALPPTRVLCPQSPPALSMCLWGQEGPTCPGTAGRSAGPVEPRLAPAQVPPEHEAAALLGDTLKETP